MEKVAFVLRHDLCHMEPGHIVVEKNDEIRFSVVGKCTRVTVMFPDGTIFGQSGPYTVSLDKTPGSSSAPHQKLKIDANALEGTYSFAAYCEDTKSFACGGSDPEIIIQT